MEFDSSKPDVVLVTLSAPSCCAEVHVCLQHGYRFFYVGFVSDVLSHDLAICVPNLCGGALLRPIFKAVNGKSWYDICGLSTIVTIHVAIRVSSSFVFVRKAAMFSAASRHSFSETFWFRYRITGL